MKRTLIFLLLLLAAGCSRAKVIEREVALEPPVMVVKAPTEPIKRAKPTKPHTPSKKGLIIVDPGHGGKDLGTFSHTPPRYQEKNLNLAASHMLRTFLVKLGYDVEMTRVDDTFIALEDRSALANKRKPLLFVSVHFNSAPSKEAHGIEVFYYKSDENKERTTQSKLLAKKVLDQVIATTEAKSRGVKHGNLAVIRETTMPAILVEGGFLTNEAELQKIKDPHYMKQIAWGIAQGVDGYVNKK